MKPEVGDVGNYYSPECSLRVEVLSYEEFEENSCTVKKVRLKNLRNLDPDSKLEYPEGEIITYVIKTGDNDNLEGLILDSGLKI